VHSVKWFCEFLLVTFIIHSVLRGKSSRSTHIWLDHILKTEIGKVVDWSKVNKEDYLLAMERSPIN